MYKITLPKKTLTARLVNSKSYLAFLPAYMSVQRLRRKSMVSWYCRCTKLRSLNRDQCEYCRTSRKMSVNVQPESCKFAVQLLQALFHSPTVLFTLVYVYFQYIFQPLLHFPEEILITPPDRCRKALSFTHELSFFSFLSIQSRSGWPSNVF